MEDLLDDALGGSFQLGVHVQDSCIVVFAGNSTGDRYTAFIISVCRATFDRAL